MWITGAGTLIVNTYTFLIFYKILTYIKTVLFVSLLIASFTVFDNAFGDGAPSLVTDLVIDQNGSLRVYYDFDNIPEPSFGMNNYIITINNVNHPVGIDGEGKGSLGMACCNNMNIGGLVTGNNVHEMFAQVPHLAHFGVPSLTTPTPGLYCGQPIPYYSTVINGTSGNDYLVGTWGNDLILGFAGDDYLKGKWGSDCLVGGTGEDVFFSNRVFSDNLWCEDFFFCSWFLPSNTIMSDGADLCVYKKNLTIIEC